MEKRRFTRMVRVLMSVMLTGTSVVMMGAGGCGPDPEPAWQCVNGSPVPTRSLASAGENVGQVQQGLNAAPAQIWTTPKIPVCWEKDAWATVSENDRAIVKEAIDSTWNNALALSSIPPEKQVQFVGWQSCDTDANANKNGVHITAGDVNPRTLGLGKELAGLPQGMLLDFTFKQWSPKCSGSEIQRQFCVAAIAVHEFGHALGLAHEQNRTDTPSTCDQPAQGGDGTAYYGAWDQYSVMNYCNPTWNNAGQLSTNDKAGIQSLYYTQDWKNICAPQNATQAALQTQLATDKNPAVATRILSLKPSEAIGAAATAKPVRVSIGK